jgi:hypothetical protein
MLTVDTVDLTFHTASIDASIDGWTSEVTHDPIVEGWEIFGHGVLVLVPKSFNKIRICHCQIERNTWFTWFLLVWNTWNMWNMWNMWPQCGGEHALLGERYLHVLFLRSRHQGGNGGPSVRNCDHRWCLLHRLSWFLFHDVTICVFFFMIFWMLLLL